MVISSLKIRGDRLTAVQEACAEAQVSLTVMRFVMQRLDDVVDTDIGAMQAK